MFVQLFVCGRCPLTALPFPNFFPEPWLTSLRLTTTRPARQRWAAAESRSFERCVPTTSCRDRAPASVASLVAQPTEVLKSLDMLDLSDNEITAAGCATPSYTQSQIEDCSVRNGFGIAVSVIQGPCGMAVSVPGRPSTRLGTAVPVPNQSLNAHRDPSPSPSTLIGTHVPVPTQSRPSPDQSRPCRRLPKTAKDWKTSLGAAEDPGDVLRY